MEEKEGGDREKGREGAGGPSSGMSGRRIGHRAQWLTSGCCSSVASLWKRGVHFISEDKGQGRQGGRVQVLSCIPILLSWPLC